MTTITAHSRTYHADHYNEAYLSIVDAVGGIMVSVWNAHDTALLTTFAAPEARRLGTTLIHWAGNHSLHGEGEFIGTNDYALRLYAVDGEIEIALCTDGDEDRTVEFRMNTDDAIDLGQRLIVHAGVAL